MANPKQIETLLLTEHFKFTPITLIDEIINNVNLRASSTNDSIESSLLNADPTALGFDRRAKAEGRVPEKDEDGRDMYPESKLEIEEGVHQLETLLENSIDRNFDRFEIYVLRNVLSVPEELVPWVRLGHYENLTIPTLTPNTPTPESLQLLRRKLQETQKLHTALLAEKTRNASLLSRLRALLSPSPPPPKAEHSSSPARNLATLPSTSDGAFAFLTHTPAAQTLGIQPIPSAATARAASGPESATVTGPISTHTTFTIAQLPALRAQLAALKPYLATASLPAARGTSEAAEAARERKEYVESQTRRVLERRGVDVRNGGAVEGRRVGAEEVRALEGLVGVLGKGREDAGPGAEDGGDEMDTGE